MSGGEVWEGEEYGGAFLGTFFVFFICGGKWAVKWSKRGRDVGEWYKG